MEKLFIWYNPNTSSFYQRWGRGIIHLKPGEYNSFGHLLVEIYECYDNELVAHLTTYQRHLKEVQEKKLRNKREKRLLNIFKNMNRKEI